MLPLLLNFITPVMSTYEKSTDKQELQLCYAFSFTVVHLIAAG